MGEKINSINVTELLRQLEDLKKKRAHNEKILKKLEKRVSNKKISNHSKSTLNSFGLTDSSDKRTQEAGEVKHDVSPKKKENDINCPHLQYKAQGLLCHDSKLSLACSESECENVKNKENCAGVDNYSNIKTNIRHDVHTPQNVSEKLLYSPKGTNYISVKNAEGLEKAKSDDVNSTEITDITKNNKTFLRKDSQKRLSSSEHLQMCKNMEVDCYKKIKFSSKDEIGKEKIHKITTVKTQKEENKLNVCETFNCNRHAECHCISSKNTALKTSPDCLDDCLEKDMTCFFSSEMLNISEDEGKMQEFASKNANCAQIGDEKVCDFSDLLKEQSINSTRTGSELFGSNNNNISPAVSGNFNDNDLEQNNHKISNFSKFSTPIDNIRNSLEIASEKNIRKKNEEYMKTTCNKNLMYHVFDKEVVEMDDSLTGNFVLSMEQGTSVQSVQRKEFSQPELKCIISTNLSSVLDAHYGSPKKCSTSKCVTLGFKEIGETVDCYYSKIIEGEERNKNALHDINCLDAVNKSEFLNEIPDCASNNCEISLVSVHFNNNIEANSNHNENKLLLIHEESFECDEKISNCHKSSLQVNVFKNVTNIDDEIISDSQSSGYGHHKSLFNALPNSYVNINPNAISLQIEETVDHLITNVCEVSQVVEQTSKETSVLQESLVSDIQESSKFDSEIIIIPETEGLGTILGKDSEITESSIQYGIRKENGTFNNSKSTKMGSVNVLSNINGCDIVNGESEFIANRESKNNSTFDQNIYYDFARSENLLEKVDEAKTVASTLDHISANKFSGEHKDAYVPLLMNDSLELDSDSIGVFLEGENVPETTNTRTNVIPYNNGECLSFSCCLHSEIQEPVINVELILFNNSNYMFVQHLTQIQVWRKEKSKEWVKILLHKFDSMHNLVKMELSKNDSYLVLIMLFIHQEVFSLQFLLFESDSRIIKLMDHIHPLKNKLESVLLCGLEGFMFATAQGKSSFNVFAHALSDLKSSPRLITSELGSTVNPLCSLCKTEKLPNALIGISQSELYVWHLLEARLVTLVSLAPQDYLPIKNCFWSTVEKGLIFFLTSCKNENDCHVCQLLAANLATGFCQVVMTYSLQPAVKKKPIKNMIKVTYYEPYIAASCQGTAFLWSVNDEYCCAALDEMTSATSISVGKSLEDWGLIAVGLNTGCVNCYSIKAE